MSEIAKALQTAVAFAFIAYVINVVVTLSTGGHW